MIGRLQGKLLLKAPPELLVDIGGVGYEVQAPMSTCFNLPEIGSEVVLLIHMVVREDAQLLYGFVSESERRLFRSLLKVSGVGAKLGLAILSGCTVDEFARVVGEGDVAALTKLPGVGKKTAERLIVEMRDKLKVDVSSLPSSSSSPVLDSPIEEAVSALIALGYKGPEASKMVRKLEAEGKSAEDLIREALKGA